MANVMRAFFWTLLFCFSLAALVDVALDKLVVEVFSGSGAKATTSSATSAVGWYSSAFADFPDKSLYPETLLLDLAGVYNISSVSFTPPTSGVSCLPRNFSISASLPGQASWTLLAEVASSASSSATPATAAFPPTLARYVRVLVSAVTSAAPNYTLSVGRLHVLGEPGALPPPPVPWPPAAPPQPPTPPLPAQLLVEGRVNPPDIDTPNPLLSWVLQSSRAGDGVSAWQVMLNSTTATLWDTGRVNGSAYATPAQPPQPLVSGDVLQWSVRLWDASGTPTAWAPPATFALAKLGGSADFRGAWIGADPQLLLPGAFGPGHPAVYLRASFALPARPIARAVASFVGLGWGKLFINGALAHAHLELSPGFTTYEYRTQYNVLNVTALLQAAPVGQPVVVGAVLGDGWYALAHDSSCCARFQSQQYVNSTRMLLDLDVYFADSPGGSEKVTLTSNASWEWALGEVTSTHFNGESVDKRWALPPDWASSSGSSGSSSSSGSSGPPPWGTWRPVTLLDGPPALFPGSRLTSQKEPPTLSGGLLLSPQTVRITAPLPTSGMRAYVIDFGREVQGRPVLTATASSPGLQLRTLVCGSFYLTRSFTCDEFTNSSLNNGEGPGLYNFTLAGGGEEEVYRPLFTYSALRRLVVHVPPGAALVSALAEQVVMEQRGDGTFASSSDTYNWLHEALARTQLNYCTGFPNDPSRERVGYTQDMMNMFRGAAYHFGAPSQAMYTRWIDDMLDGQAYSVLHPGSGIPRGAGQMPTVIPGPKSDQANSVFWGGMMVWLPWRHYLHYGDARILNRTYAASVAYVEYLNASAAPSGLIEWGLADWNSPLPQCSAWGYSNATALINTPGLYLLSAVLSQVAAFLGQQGDAARFSALATRTAQAYNAAFLNATSGEYATGQQCHQAMALAMPGLVPPGAVRDAAVAALVARIAQDNTSLTVGFVSFLHAVQALAEAEEAGVLHALVTRRNYGPAEGVAGYCAGADGPGGRPSTRFGCAPGPYSNSVGAFPSSDLMKESWQGEDAVMPSLSGPLLVHSYATLAGVRTAEALGGAGFGNFSVYPSPVGGLLWVNASVATRLGEVRVAWVVAEEGGERRHFYLSVVIPPGATATVGLPCNTTTLGGGGSSTTSGTARTLVVVSSGAHYFDCQLQAAAWLQGGA